MEERTTILLGYGIQSKAILHYLLKETNNNIKIVEIKFPEDVRKELENESRVELHSGTAESIFYQWAQFGGNVVVISCLPTHLNPEIARICVSRGWSYIDLGGKLSDTEQVMDYGKNQNQCTVVPDCGIAPGLVSSVAGALKRAGANSVNLYCGGLPIYPKGPLKYIKAFNVEGVYKEYTGLVEYRTQNKLAYMPTLSSREKVYIRGLGTLEAEPTSGSISIAARELELKHLSYKTLRYSGHWDYVKDNIMWQPNPIEILDKMTEDLSPKNPDLIVLQVETDGPFIEEALGEVDAHRLVTWIWKYNHKLNIGAMAEITGYTVASVATMIHDGILDSGVVQMHNIDFLELKKRIQKMPDQFKNSY